MSDINGLDLDGSGGGKDIRGIVERKAIIRNYCKKNYFLQKKTKEAC